MMLKPKLYQKINREFQNSLDSDIYDNLSLESRPIFYELNENLWMFIRQLMLRLRYQL